MNRTLLLVIVVCLFSEPPNLFAQEESFSFGPFGKVRLYRAHPRPERIVLFISGAGGWNTGAADMAEKLASTGNAVAGIDVTGYLRRLDASGGACTYPAADFEALSKYVQKKLALPRYTLPVLVGYASGASLVYAVLAQSPPSTFQGGISLSFCPDLKLRKPLCRGQGLATQRNVRSNTTVLLPVRAVSSPWIVLQGAIDRVCDPGEAGSFVKRVPDARIVLLPGVGHDFSVSQNWLPQFLDACSSLAQADQTPEINRAVSDLPLVEIPVRKKEADTIAIIVSGDGGWAGLDREVGNALAARGIPVVGLNSLQYFWTKRTPAGASADLTRIVRHYSGAWDRKNVILIGYSLGAEVLPFMAARLPADVLGRVREIALLGPGKRTQFEFHFSEWLGLADESTALPVKPEVNKLRGRNILCFYGAGERDSLCPDLEQSLAELIVMPGGHHFGGRYREIAVMILKAAARGKQVE
jgi:type IV secretory pathway VirJ component